MLTSKAPERGSFPLVKKLAGNFKMAYAKSVF